MNRAQRRQQARKKENALANYERATMFTKEQLEALNERAYIYGIAFVFKALNEVYGWGDTRIDRLREKVAAYEKHYFKDMNQFEVDPKAFIQGKGAAAHGTDKSSTASKL